MRADTTPVRRAAAALLASVALAGGAVRAGEKHEHGVARLDVALDGTRVEIVLDSPLANLIGFEQAPANPAQRRVADAAVATLRDAGRLFRLEAAAGCRSSAVELRSAALGLGGAASTPAGEHADLEARYTFECTRAPATLEQTLFDAFVRLQRLEVQIVTPTRQAGQTLRRPAARLKL